MPFIFRNHHSDPTLDGIITDHGRFVCQTLLAPLHGIDVHKQVVKASLKDGKYAGAGVHRGTHLLLNVLKRTDPDAYERHTSDSKTYIAQCAMLTEGTIMASPAPEQDAAHGPITPDAIIAAHRQLLEILKTKIPAPDVVSDIIMSRRPETPAAIANDTAVPFVRG